MRITHCRIARRGQRKLVEFFVAEVTARTADDLVGCHRNTAALYYHKLRGIIASKMAEIDPELGVFECDESYFGGVRKGKRGRGAAGKVCGFGILKRRGKGYALPVADASSNNLLTTLKTKIKADSAVYTDSLPSYNILDISGFKHHRVNHAKHFVSKRGNHINGMKTSGISPSVSCVSITGCPEGTSCFSSKNASLDSTTALQVNSSKPCALG